MHQFRFAVFWVVVPLLTAILVFAQAKEMGYEERSQIDSALGQISKDVVQTLQRPQAARYRLVFESSGDAPKDPGRKALNMAITRVAAVLDSLIAGRQDEYSFADTKIHFAEIGRDLAVLRLPSFMFDEGETNKGTIAVTAYGTSITDANLIMADGKSLEHGGLLLDESMLPLQGIWRTVAIQSWHAPPKSRV